VTERREALALAAAPAVEQLRLIEFLVIDVPQSKFEAYMGKEHRFRRCG